jgi:hypothetical protein
MKLYRKIAILALGTVLFSSCNKEDGPDAGDNFMNFEIPKIEVTEDFPVGVYYFNPGAGGQDGARYSRLLEPYDTGAEKIGPYLDFEFGNYRIDQDVTKITDEMINIVQQHVDWCIGGGIDFFIMPALRAEKNQLAPNCINGDYRFYDLVLGKNPSAAAVGGSGKRVDMKSLKFALTINMEDPICNANWDTYNADGSVSGKATALSNTVLLEDNNQLVGFIDNKTYTRTDMLKEFFKSLSRYFSDEHYFRVDGKPLVVLQNPHKLYSKDSKAIYAELRRIVKEYSGEDMYIVAQQDQWTPPARFEYFYKGSADAVTHKNMYNNGEWSRSVFYPQAIYLNWEYSREFFRDNWGGTDYIPTGAVAFNSFVDNNSFDKPQVYHDGDTFRTMCNVMKSQAGSHRIVFIDSFNQIQYSSFLEPTKKEYGNGFGTLFLDIVKEQFKR